ncbi:PHP domain-containing protein [Candidatus Formimonas warabiya]|uniref:Phosphatase n=1 Tax=Formimonas warabiya TaxID=1761012 RepID=A0A3G1KVZ4_FORW1|nr:PHP domain-containing protein [Candidatus Formimonas warabiya]ATW26644.1 phosphatase [Candidatus Formimonas warabiya]
MIDLHVHTKVSDNSLSTGEVILQAREKGITHIAITDHDTTKGIGEAMELGKQMGVGIIPGIEISAYDFLRHKRAHILGYYVEPGHPSLERLCIPLTQSRNQASYQMVGKVMAAGYAITWEGVLKYGGGTGVYKQHIMHALLDQGYCDSIYGDLYKKLFGRGDNGEPRGIAYVPLVYIDARAAIRAVREAGGIPVLAHPGQFANFDAVDEWVTLGLGGIEVFHPSHYAHDCMRARDYAGRHHLIITGGSDFHGAYSEMPLELGCPELGEECITALAALKQTR